MTHTMIRIMKKLHSNLPMKYLEGVPQRDEDPAVAAVRGRLVQKVESCHVRSPVWNTKVTMVWHVEHIGAELECAPFSNVDLLRDIEVYTSEAVRPQKIPRDVACRTCNSRTTISCKSAEIKIWHSAAGS